jgi:hypothetical protein
MPLAQRCEPRDEPFERLKRRARVDQEDAVRRSQAQMQTHALRGHLPSIASYRSSSSSGFLEKRQIDACISG